MRRIQGRKEECAKEVEGKYLQKGKKLLKLGEDVGAAEKKFNSSAPFFFLTKPSSKETSARGKFDSMACYYIVISSTHLRDGQLRSIKGVFRGPIGASGHKSTVRPQLLTFCV